MRLQNKKEIIRKWWWSSEFHIVGTARHLQIRSSFRIWEKSAKNIKIWDKM